MSQGKRTKREDNKRQENKKTHRIEEAKQTLHYLIESIEAKDKSYISEFLCSNNKLISLKLLNDVQLNSLSLLLVEFLDQPLRVQEIEVLKAIPNGVRDKATFFDTVKSRVIDISKLLYLKGKLDYLKLTRLPSDKTEPKAVVRLEEE